MRESGERTTRLHNNCSGKHATMLAHARGEGWPTEGYERIEHPVQQAVLDIVERWTDISRHDLELGVDGCGVVVFALPLEAMARAYSRLSRASVTSGGEGEEARRIAAAMLGNPFLVGGTDRFDTVLMEESGGTILCKVGAEGVHCAALLESGIGIALKVEATVPRVHNILLSAGSTTASWRTARRTPPSGSRDIARPTKLDPQYATRSGGRGSGYARRAK